MELEICRFNVGFKNIWSWKYLDLMLDSRRFVDVMRDSRIFNIEKSKFVVICCKFVILTPVLNN